MNKKVIRCMSLLLALCSLICVLPVRAYQPGGVDQVNTYVNTGNQREDIIGVALTQLGYREKDENDTKYGDWYGLPSNPWCAMFISWCARQADISTDILKENAWAHPNSFGIPYYHGSKYTPKPGDLFFTKDFEHTGIVWYVEGEFFYCIEGNAKYHDYQVPNDPNVDSYHVMTNKRLIRDHYFGVPAYKGCDKDHDYVKSYTAGHPHKTYYQCRTCGDRYETGYTQVVTGCGSCFSCGCSSQSAGYYKVSTSTNYITLKASHSSASKSLCYVTPGSVVYVYGINQAAGWAYVDYDGKRGHIPVSYLTKYANPPAAPKVTSAKTEYTVADRIEVSWDKPSGTEQFRMQVLRDGKVYTEKTLGTSQKETFQSLPSGNYEIRITARNLAGQSQAGVLKLTVRNVYTLSYDTRGGSGGPGSQTQPQGQTVTISKTIPTRDGYTFLGWTQDSGSNFADYNGGDTLRSDRDIKLYAVWKRNDAMPLELSVGTLPLRTRFLLNEELDTSGMVLRQKYADGSGHRIFDGFSVSGYDPGVYGDQTLTVTYGGLTTTYAIQVVPYIPGDMDGNRYVNRDDVMQILWHISFPEKFPIDAVKDFTEDGKVNRDDVIRLLWHITFPEKFPIDVIWPEGAQEIPS